MIGKILGFWLVNWHMIWSCINLSESYINLPVFVCMYVCSFLLPMQRSRRQSWDKFVINCFGVWYNLYLAIRGLYHPRLRLGWYSPLIARYKLYHTPKQLIINNVPLLIKKTSFEVKPCKMETVFILRWAQAAKLKKTYIWNTKTSGVR